MEYERAKALVIARVEARGVGGDEGVGILEEMSERRPYGWLLYYNSVAFLRTGNPLESLVGAGPVVVIEKSGEIYELGSARSAEVEIAALEQKLGLHGNLRASAPDTCPS